MREQTDQPTKAVERLHRLETMKCCAADRALKPTIDYSAMSVPDKSGNDSAKGWLMGGINIAVSEKEASLYEILSSELERFRGTRLVYEPRENSAGKYVGLALRPVPIHPPESQGHSGRQRGSQSHE